MHSWNYIIETESEILKYVEVPSGYLYKYMRREPTMNIAGSEQWGIVYETVVHGNKDQTSRETTANSERSLEGTSSSTEIPKIRRRSKKRNV